MNQLKAADLRELIQILDRAGEVDIHFVKGLITAFACVDGSADGEFLTKVLLGDNPKVVNDIIDTTRFVDLLDILITQTLDELYEFRYKLPPKSQFNSTDFNSNFSADNPIANWARGVHCGLNFCYGHAKATDQDAVREVYEQLMEFSCVPIFVFIDAEIARAVYQNSNWPSVGSIEHMMTQLRKRLPYNIKELIELGYQLVTEGSDGAWGEEFEYQQEAPEGFEPDSLGVVDQLLQQSEIEPNKKRRIQLLEQAVNLGRSQLGPDFFVENIGMFWGLVETRPFMRVLVNLADAYRQAHMREKSLLCYRECLLLCPGDNLGARFLLPALLMEMGDFDEALRQIDSNSEEVKSSAFLAYSRALCLIALQQPEKNIQKALKLALKTNTHIPALLLTAGALPDPDSPYCGLGDTNEAIFYSIENRMLWRNINGALAYL